MPSASISGFKNWSNGAALNGSAWSSRNTIACGATGYVGALRFTLGQAASSITVSATAYRRLAAGAMYAEIRTSELNSPTPGAVGADASFTAPAVNSAAEITFTGSYPAGTYYVYITSASAYVDFYASNTYPMSVSYEAGGGCTLLCESSCQECEGYCESGCQVYCQSCEGSACQSCESC